MTSSGLSYALDFSTSAEYCVLSEVQLARQRSVESYHPCTRCEGGICDLGAERHGSNCPCARCPAQGRGCPSGECAERHVCGSVEDRGDGDDATFSSAEYLGYPQGVTSRDRGGRSRCVRHKMSMQRSDVEEAQLVFTGQLAIASVLHSKCREEADAAELDLRLRPNQGWRSLKVHRRSIMMATTSTLHLRQSPLSHSPCLISSVFAL